MVHVAPRAGAWIETFPPSTGSGQAQVAPRAGAWIETDWLFCRDGKWRVAPHAGAWIETWAVRADQLRASRPPRGGVDRNIDDILKLRDLGVAPRAGAWIETKR